MTSVRQYSTIAVAVALGVAVLATVVPRRASERVFFGALADLLPRADELPGWTVEHRPVAETASLREATMSLLRYDDAVHAIFVKGGMRISVFGVYWTPGKVSSRTVAGHTPDVCWVAQGWNTLHSETSVLRPPGPGVESINMEHRIYVGGAETEHVVFYHMVGGHRRTYGLVGAPPWHAMFSDVLTHGLQLRDEQFFWRISSNRPLAEFKDSAPVQGILRSILEVSERRSNPRRSAELRHGDPVRLAFQQP